MEQRQFRSDDTSVWAYKYGTGGAGSVTFSSSLTLGASQGTYYGTLTGTQGNTTASVSLADGTYNLPCKIHDSYLATAITQNWEYNVLVSVSGGTATLLYPLTLTYNSGTQIVTANPYQSITIDSGKIITIPAWNGSTGGILFLIAKQFITNSGTITVNSCGYRGGNGDNNSNGFGQQGESWTGVGTLGVGSPNGSGGAGGKTSGTDKHGAGRGANATYGTADDGAPAGTIELVSQAFGGGGGGLGRDNESSIGSHGGGIIDIVTPVFTNSGIIDLGSLTTNYADNGGSITGSAGTGGGGSILFKGISLTLGTITAVGAVSGGGAPGQQTPGGSYGEGRIHADYARFLSSSTITPTVNSRLDKNLDELFFAGTF